MACPSAKAGVSTWADCQRQARGPHLGGLSNRRVSRGRGGGAGSNTPPSRLSGSSRCSRIDISVQVTVSRTLDERTRADITSDFQFHG